MLRGGMDEQRFAEFRQFVRQFDPLSVIREALAILHHRIDRREFPDWDGYYPWTVLLTIRWTLQVTDAEGEGGNRAIDADQFRHLHHLIMGIAPGLEIAGQRDDLSLPDIMRRLIFPQLPYQARPYEIKASLGRQLILFDAMATDALQEMLASFTSLTVREFLEIYYSYWVACVSEDAHRVDIAYFNGLFPEAALIEFFRILSLDLNGARDMLRAHTDARASISYQAHEHTPLAQTPFFRDGARVVPYTRRLLESTIQENLYDLFKARGGNDFAARHFGPIFEAYVGQGVRYLVGDAHRTEDQIKASTRGEFKAPDFQVDERDATIFIEAKCTELNAIARVLQGPQSLARNLSCTVLKGLVQMNSAASVLIDQGRLLADRPLFGIVVTFKEHLAGEGAEFWEAVARPYVEAELAKDGLRPSIPPAHLFVLSVDDFDYMIAGLRQRGGSLSGLLCEIVARNADGRTRAFLMSQHLKDLWGHHYLPPYVETATDALLAGIEDRFSEEDRAAYALSLA